MDINSIYPLVLMLCMVGLVLGISVLVLDKFSQTSGITGATELALNNTRAAITPIASTWLPLLVTIAVLAIILGLVMGAFNAGGRK
jgi:type II secretory pathway component PulF